MTGKNYLWSVYCVTMGEGGARHITKEWLLEMADSLNCPDHLVAPEASSQPEGRTASKNPPAIWKETQTHLLAHYKAASPLCRSSSTSEE